MQSAEELLDNNLLILEDNYDMSEDERIIILKSMKEYAEQFIDEAAEKVNKFDTLVDTYNCVNRRNEDVSEIILNIKKQIQ